MNSSASNITKKEWAQVIALLVGIKIIFLSIFFFAQLYLPKKEYPAESWMTRPETRLIDNLANFDGAWFIRIAALGYQKLTDGDYDLEQETKRLWVMDRLGYEDGVERKFAYRHWPLFPWLIRILAPVFKGSYLYAGIFISTLFYLLLGICFYQLARLDFSPNISILGLLFLLVHPAAYTLNVVYNEALFLTLISACFYFLRKERYFLSGVLGALGGLTRIEMAGILVPIIYEYLRKGIPESAGLFEPFKKKNWALAFARLYQKPSQLWLILIPLGCLAVLFYFKMLSGSALIFTEPHMRSVFGKAIYPGQAILLGYRMGPAIYLKHYPYYLVFTLVFIFSWRKIPMSYWVWIASFWVVCTLLGPSGLRHPLLIIPLFLALARLVESQAILKYIYIIASVSLMTFYAVMHINGYFVW